MKIFLTIIAITLAAAGAVLAEDKIPNPEKDMCLLDSQNCAKPYDLVQKVARLRSAIGKGTRVYTSQELELLERKLEDNMIIVEFLDVPEGTIPR